MEAMLILMRWIAHYFSKVMKFLVSDTSVSLIPLYFLCVFTISAFILGSLAAVLITYAAVLVLALGLLIVSVVEY